MRIIEPVESANLVISDTDVPLLVAAYNAGDTYSENDQVSYTDNKVYTYINGTPSSGNAPPNTTYWVEYSATNPYKVLDTLVYSKSQINSTSGYWEFTLSELNGSIAFLDMENVTSINISIDVTGETNPVYNEPITLLPGQSSAYKIDLPLFVDSVVTVTFTGTNPMKVGEIVIGRPLSIGITEYGASAGIVDYSSKQTDFAGNFEILERAFSKRADVTGYVEPNTFNYMFEKLSAIRAVPVVWILSDNTAYDSSMLIYGFYKDFEMKIPNVYRVDLSLSIEGLV